VPPQILYDGNEKLLLSLYMAREEVHIT